MSRESGNNSSSSGIGFCGLLTIVFITLKLTKVINWSWWWVLSPSWIPIAIVMAILIIVIIVKLIPHFKRMKRIKKRMKDVIRKSQGDI